MEGFALLQMGTYAVVVEVRLCRGGYGVWGEKKFEVSNATGLGLKR
jgi:hypothetical protein